MSDDGDEGKSKTGESNPRRRTAAGSASAFNTLLADLEVKRPRKLVHYTNLSGAFGVLGSHTIWASDPRYLNDARELDYIEQPLEDAFERIIADADDQLLSEGRGDLAKRLRAAMQPHTVMDFASLPEHERKILIDRSNDIYVTCFCSGDVEKADDRLSQWRGYGGTSGPAYALTFDAGAFRHFASTQDAEEEHPRKPYLWKVVYDYERQVLVLTRFINGLLDALEFQDGEVDEPVLQSVAFSGRSGLIYPASCFKHPGFAEEDEWRLILHGSEAKPKFRPAQLALTPYKELAPRPTDEELKGPTATRSARFRERLPLLAVMQGPTRAPELALRSVRSFLASAGYPELAADPEKVSLSSIPFRPQD